MHRQAPRVPGKDPHRSRRPRCGVVVLSGEVSSVFRPRLYRGDLAATVEKERRQVADPRAHFQNIPARDWKSQTGKVFKSPRVHPEIGGIPERGLGRYHIKIHLELVAALNLTGAV